MVWTEVLKRKSKFSRPSRKPCLQLCHGLGHGRRPRCTSIAPGLSNPTSPRAHVFRGVQEISYIFMHFHWISMPFQRWLKLGHWSLQASHHHSQPTSISQLWDLDHKTSGWLKRPRFIASRLWVMTLIDRLPKLRHWGPPASLALPAPCREGLGMWPNSIEFNLDPQGENMWKYRVF